MTRRLCGVAATVLMAACSSSPPCECGGARDPATGQAFDRATFDFTQEEESNSRHGSVETDAAQVVITYQTDDGRMFRVVYEKRGHSIAAM